MKQPLVWTGGPREFTGVRGNRLIAKIVRDGDTFSLYDQQWTEHEGLGDLKAAGVSLDEAKRRAEEM